MIVKSKKKVFIIIGVISLVVSTISYDIYYAYILSKDFKIVDAKIVSYKFLSGARKAIEYTYEVDNIEYRKSKGVTFFECAESDNKKDFCIGLQVKVKYYPRNPNINEVILGKYERFKTVSLRHYLFK